MIDRLQNYYGIAIRSNVGDLDKMKKAIYASLFHCAHPRGETFMTIVPKELKAGVGLTKTVQIVCISLGQV